MLVRVHLCTWIVLREGKATGNAPEKAHDLLVRRRCRHRRRGRRRRLEASTKPRSSRRSCPPAEASAAGFPAPAAAAAPWTWSMESVSVEETVSGGEFFFSFFSSFFFFFESERELVRAKWKKKRSNALRPSLHNRRVSWSFFFVFRLLLSLRMPSLERCRSFFLGATGELREPADLAGLSRSALGGPERARRGRQALASLSAQLGVRRSKKKKASSLASRRRPLAPRARPSRPRWPFLSTRLQPHGYEKQRRRKGGCRTAPRLRPRGSRSSECRRRRR